MMRNTTPVSRRFRLAAAVLTRAACLRATNAVLHSWRTHDGTYQENRTTDFGLDGLISHARKDVLHLHFRHDGQPIRQDSKGPGDAVLQLAQAMVVQRPRNRTPDVPDLIQAANRLKDFAEYEEFLHATEPRTFHLIAQSSPYRPNFDRKGAAA